MRLVLGGRAQGKLAWVLQSGGCRAEDVCDGGECDLFAVSEKPIVNHLHLLIRRLMEDGRDPRALLGEITRANPNIILITDEIGCGVVPIDPFEREWRETTGRICCELARESARVERVFAGFATVIKGDYDAN